MSENKSVNKLVSRIEGMELIIERVFEAPRELVFSVFRSCSLSSLVGPQGWVTEVHEMDFQVK